MPNTPRGYPVPVGTDPADVPADMQAALEAVDTDVTTVEVGVTNNKNDIVALDARVVAVEGREITQRGTASITFSNTDVATILVTFPVAFSGTPTVTVAGDSQYKLGFARNASTTNVDVGLWDHRGPYTGGPVSCMWIAVGPA